MHKVAARMGKWVHSGRPVHHRTLLAGCNGLMLTSTCQHVTIGFWHLELKTFHSQPVVWFIKSVSQAEVFACYLPTFGIHFFLLDLQISALWFDSFSIGLRRVWRIRRRGRSGTGNTTKWYAVMVVFAPTPLAK